MPLILFPADVVEENIKDHRRRVELVDVRDTNKRLKTDKAGFVDRLETANNDAQRHKIQLEKVKSNLKKAKEEKQASTQAVTVHEHALTTFRKTMKSSNVNMAAIPQLEKMIVESEDLLKKQLGDVIGRLYKLISESATIGSKPDDGWVQWAGGSHCSGQEHAECIVRAMVTFNTLMTQYDVATMAGVMPDNHGVKNAFKSLLKGNVIIASNNNLNQVVYLLALSIKLHLTHEIPPTNKRYQARIAEGNACIRNRALAKAANQAINDSDEEELGEIYEEYSTYSKQYISHKYTHHDTHEPLYTPPDTAHLYFTKNISVRQPCIDQFPLVNKLFLLVWTI